MLRTFHGQYLYCKPDYRLFCLNHHEIHQFFVNRQGSFFRSFLVVLDPNPPTNIMFADVNTTSFRCTWRAPTHDVTGYSIVVTNSNNEVHSRNVAASVREFELSTGLTSGATYDVTIRTQFAIDNVNARPSERLLGSVTLGKEK